MLKNNSYMEYIKCVSPAILTLLVISLYTIIDGIFVGRYVGSKGLAAINILMPLQSILIGVAIMIATGSSTLIAIKVGEKKYKEASENFSLTFFVLLFLSILISFFGIIHLKNLALFLGATPLLLNFTFTYGKLVLFGSPFIFTKLFFEYFLRVEGRSDFALASTIIGGMTNIILDYIFIAKFNMGIAGAGYATATGFLITTLLGLFYFLFNSKFLKFQKFKYDFIFLKNTFVNGSSELITSSSSGITTFLLNISVVKYAGEQGIAAISIILYLHFLLSSVFIGLTTGALPLISYYLGSNKLKEIRDIFNKSILTIGTLSIAIFFTTFIFSDCLISPFAKNNAELFALSKNGFSLFSFCFLILGFNIFASGYYTALNKGGISAFLSINRSLIFVSAGILILPIWFDLDGIWLAIPFAESMTLLIALFVLKKYNLINIYRSKRVLKKNQRYLEAHL